MLLVFVNEHGIFSIERVALLLPFLCGALFKRTRSTWFYRTNYILCPNFVKHYPYYGILNPCIQLFGAFNALFMPFLDCFHL